MGMRGSSIVFKFMLTIYMARYLELADIGKYALITAIVMLYINLAGFGFQFFVSRKVAVHHGDDSIYNILTNQLFFNSAVYVLSIPVFAGIYMFELAPKEYIFYFIAICILEHFSEDLYTLIVNIGKPVIANIVFFIKSAAWVIPIAALGVLYEEYRSLSMLFAGWTVGLVVSVIIALFFVRHNISFSKISYKLLDISWISNGLRTGLMFYVSVIIGVSSLYADRFIISSFIGIDMLGIYLIIWSFCNAIFQIIRNGIIVFYRPKLVKFAQDKEKFSELYRTCFQNALFPALLLSICVAVIFPYIDPFFKKEQLSGHHQLLWILLIVTCFRVISDVQMLNFYAKHKDTLFMKSNLSYFVMTLLFQMSFVYFYGLLGVGMGILAATIIRISLNQRNISLLNKEEL